GARELPPCRLLLELAPALALDVVLADERAAGAVVRGHQLSLLLQRLIGGQPVHHLRERHRLRRDVLVHQLARRRLDHCQLSSRAHSLSLSAHYAASSGVRPDRHHVSGSSVLRRPCSWRPFARSSADNSRILRLSARIVSSSTTSASRSSCAASASHGRSRMRSFAVRAGRASHSARASSTRVAGRKPYSVAM